MKGLWILLNVGNVDESIEFYRLLGLKVKRDEMGPMVWGEVHVMENAGFILWDKNAVMPGPNEADVRAWVSGELGKGVLLNVGVANATRTWAKVEGKAKVEQPLMDDEMSGGKTFTLVDPDGYVVCIMDKWPGQSKPAGKKASAKKSAKKAQTKKAPRGKKATAKTSAKRAASKKAAPKKSAKKATKKARGGAAGRR